MDRNDWDERYAGAELLWSVGPNRFLEDRVGDLKPGRALDIACGEGRNALWLAEKGWRVTAVDFSSVAIARAREIALSRSLTVDWLIADAREYRPPSRQFDLVIVMYLHMPWPDMRLVLAAAAEAVAPGGTFFLVGHDRSNLEQGRGGPRDPAVLYEPGDVADELLGLVVEKAEKVRRKVLGKVLGKVSGSGDSVTHLHTGSSRDDGAFAIDVLVRAGRPRIA